MLIFLVGFPYQIYSTYILKKYCEIKESLEEKKD